jgi:hypothetical protein
MTIHKKIQDNQIIFHTNKKFHKKQAKKKETSIQLNK